MAAKAAPAPVATTAPSAVPAPVASARLDDAEDWLALVAGSGLKGPALQLASHCSFIACDDTALRVYLPNEDAHLRSDSGVRQVTQAVAAALGRTLQLRFEAQPVNAGDTLHRRNERQRSERQIAAETSFRADPVVSQLLGQGGNIVPDSIRPLSEN